MDYKLDFLPPVGAATTLALINERNNLIESHALGTSSLSLIMEGTSYHEALDQKIELIQLNEIIYPYVLFNRATGNDLYSKIVRQTINELREKGLVEEDSPLLQEGFWDSVQSGVGNFAGGIDKVLKKLRLKKEPKGWEEAQRIFTKIAEKEGNNVVKDLVSAIESEVSGLESGLGSKGKDQNFPTNKNRNVFFSGVNTIASTYDTVVAATKKDPGEEGYMPVEVANEIIEQLRIITQKYMADTEREKGGMYASFGGGDAKEGDIDPDAHTKPMGEADNTGGNTLTEKDWEAEAAKLDDDDKKAGEEGGDTGEEIDPDAEYEKIMRGQSSPVFQRMTSLKAPLVIAGTGAALGAMGWIANQPWFHDWVLDILEISKTTTATGPSTEVVDVFEDKLELANPEIKNLGSIKSGGGGLAQQVSRLAGLDSGSNLMGKDASLADLKNVASQLGGGDTDTGLKAIASLTQGRGNPEEAYSWMKKALDAPDSLGVNDIDKEGSLWKLFAGGTRRGGGIASHAMPGKGIFSVGIGNKLPQLIIKKTIHTITRNVPRKIAGAAITTTTGGAATTVAALTGAAPILAGIGLSTVVAGAALAAIRQRAKKSSRMGTFNTLLQALELLPPQPVQDVETEPGEKSVVTITLLDSEGAEPGDTKNESRYSLASILGERTDIEISGLAGTEELEQTGGVAKFSLASVPRDVPPSVKNLMTIPFVEKGIKDFLPDLDLGGDDVEVRIVDKRSALDIPENPPKDEKPPVPFVPANIAKGNNAVVVFDPEGARVWRILKKNTFQKYAADSRKSADKDAPEFADRYAQYDSILGQLRADGVFVNSDTLESQLSKISSGKDGDQYRVTYTRTRKNKKTGETKKRKSSTGGYTDAGSVKNVADVRKNIQGAPGSRPPRNVGEMTIIYLVGSNILSALQGAGLKKDEAEAIANKAISAWAESESRPKIADLGIENDDVAKVLKSASLAEAFKATHVHRYAVVDVTPRMFNKALRALKESGSRHRSHDDRLMTLAGLS